MLKTVAAAFGAMIVLAGAAPLDPVSPIPGSQSSSARDAERGPRPEDFPNVLTMAGRPARIDDWPASRFADLGAWFAYQLPDGQDAALHGAFPGPFLPNEGAWAGLTLARLHLEDDGGRDLAAGDGEAFEASVFPGRLHQQFRRGGFAIVLDLVFVSGRSAVIRATVTNPGQQPRRVGIGWGGEGLEGGGRFTASAREVRLDTPRGGRIAVVPLTPGAARPIALPDGTGFRIRPAATVLLSPGESTLNYLGHVVCAAGEDEATARASLDDLARAPARAFMANERRWSDYLASALELDPSFQAPPGYRLAAVKALMTLLGNWRRPLGDLRHDGLVPSSAAGDAREFRARDSWAQAVALARVLPELAMSQVRAMFAHQDDEGMVPERVLVDAREGRALNSGPPLSGWATWEVFRRTRDRSFLHEMHPLLLRYHEWWGRRRDGDQDGLCEYGAGANRPEAARRESGMDDAPRFQNASLRPVDGRAWTLDLESVDLNAYLAAEKQYLAAISKQLLREDPALGAAEAKLQAAIRAWMFDGTSGYFYDASADGRGHARGQGAGAEGWVPLWAGVATKEQAAAVRRALVDPRKFATPLPFPTLAADARGFDPGGRSRGAVRLDHAYLAAQGLRRYGFGDDARRLTRQVLDGAKGLSEPGPPIREAYQAMTGEGLHAADSSAAAAHLLLLLWGP